MKIVYLADSLVLQRAGIRQYNLQLLETIATYPSLTSIQLVVPESTESLMDYEQVVVPINRVPGHQRIRQFTSIPRVVNALEPDLVIEPAHFGPFRLRPHIKRCTVIHDLTPITHESLHPTASVKSHQLLMKSVLKNSDLIITNSEATSSAILQYESSTQSIQPIYPRIEQEVQSADDSVKQLRPYILAIGTLEPRKDYLTLIKAFEQIETDCDLVIVGGNGWKHEAFDAYLQRSNKRQHIYIRGYVTEEEKVSLMTGAEVFVSTSIAEGLGLPLLELIPYHIPMLCSDIPPFKEIGGNQFHYFSVGDDRSLASKLDAILTHPDRPNFNSIVSHWNSARSTQIEQLFTTFDKWQ